MTTTEKRGFRLPWGADGRRPGDEADVDPGEAASAVLTPATDLAPAIAPSGPGTSVRSGSMLRRNQDEELGRGPFDLAPTDEVETAASAESLVDVVEPAAKPKPAETAEASAASEAPATPAEPATAWPEVDRRGSPAHVATDAPPPARHAAVEAVPRKANPLVAGLVKAMRDAARAARDETTARMRADAAARADQIRLEAVAAGAALKKRADEDVTGIREWSRAEAARIRQETESRIAERKARLATETQAHAAATEKLNGELKDAIVAFEAEMERFFDQLLKEDDPARLATLAERLPEPPTFARLGDAPAPARAPRAARTTPRKPAVRKPAEAAPTGSTPTAEPEATEVAATVDARLAPDAAAAAEAEAILGLDEEPTATATVEEAPAAADDATAVSVEADHDTNGHEAPVAEAADDADSLAAWTEALAAIRAQANGSDEEPGAEAATETTTEAAVDAGYVDTFDVASDSLLGVLNGANRINSPDDLSPEERIALLGFDEPAPGEEPAPMTATPVEVQPTEAITRVVVAGLASVPEISAFKTALVAVPGVIAVSVTSGHEGDFVFSVVHATTTDLRVAVPGFGRFSPQLTADEGAVLTFAVGEPGA